MKSQGHVAPEDTVHIPPVGQVIEGSRDDSPLP
jgi:hypothetical protein